MTVSSRNFYTGVFLIALSILSLQVIQTRILSVVTWYSMAFFAISMAMFGMTAGALCVYFFEERLKKLDIFKVLTVSCVLFGLAVLVSLVFQVGTYFYTIPSALVTVAVVWVKIVIILFPPYFFGGVAISIALTRTPMPVGVTYGVDLVGAAIGCLAALVLLNMMDGVSAMIAIGALGCLAGAFFARVGGEAAQGGKPPLWGFAGKPVIWFGVLAALAVLNAIAYPNGMKLSNVKHKAEVPEIVVYQEWNSFSRIDVYKPQLEPPFMWGPSETMPDLEIEERAMLIDGAAGTAMYRFSGDPAELDFLKYDVTNAAYEIRKEGRAAVIGVGGGRDLLSAYGAGFRDVTGVELNPVFVENLERRFVDFNAVATLPGVRLITDEARAWFASSDESFDLIQMSLVDTWAATGSGAYTLAENGLYTVEGWTHFLGRLEPDGVFTVSRWYSPDNPGETGRLISVAKTALERVGVDDAAKHLLLIGNERLATLISARSPFTDAEIATLRDWAGRMKFEVLLSPDETSPVPVLARVLASETEADFVALSQEIGLDLTPATDDRPFFFNQLLLTHIAPLLKSGGTGGVVAGNLIATFVLAIVVCVSSTMVLLTAVVPSAPSLREVSGRLATLGTLYFLLIGLGFMFVEIGLIQRLSVFLGHPVYGLAIALFGIILSTGAGSFLSERMPLKTGRHIVIWSAALALFLVSLPLWFTQLTAAAADQPLLVRAAISVLAMLPSGALMGFGFPTGMQIVNRLNPRPTPWFWAINGSAGVLASGLAVAVAMFVSIDTNLFVGAICYAVLAPVALALGMPSRRASDVVSAE